MRPCSDAKLARVDTLVINLLVAKSIPNLSDKLTSGPKMFGGVCRQSPITPASKNLSNPPILSLRSQKALWLNECYPESRFASPPANNPIAKIARCRV